MCITTKCRCGNLHFDLPEWYLDVLPPEVHLALEESLRDLFHKITNAALLGVTGGPHVMVEVANTFRSCSTEFELLQMMFAVSEDTVSN